LNHTKTPENLVRFYLPHSKYGQLFGLYYSYLKINAEKLVDANVGIRYEKQYLF